MGVSDGFKGANIATKIAFFVVLLADVVNWIAFCTTYWLENGLNIGLWRECRQFLCYMTDGTPHPHMIAVQAFAIFGFVALNFAFVLINLYMCCGPCRGNRKTGLVSSIFLFISAGSWVISVFIFGMVHGRGPLGYSFALAASAGSLALIGGLIMLKGGRLNEDATSN